MKKIALTLFAAALLLLPAKSALAAPAVQPVNLYFFWQIGCPHCTAEESWLSRLKTEYPNLVIYDFEVSRNFDNQKKFATVGKKLNAGTGSVPFTVVGDKYFIGYLNDETTGDDIETAIRYFSRFHAPDPAGEALGIVAPQTEQPGTVSTSTPNAPEKVNLPIVGEITLKNFSLPALTAIFGLLDGFNPCAMWTLIFLIGLLVGMKNKRRMWILGSAFIAASAFIYFLFMTAWLNLFLFVGFLFWVRIIIGAVAIWAGYYNLKEYRDNKDGACKVTQNEKRQKTFARLKTIVQHEKFWFALIGIILLAFAVNLVEAICSAGLPAVYTQILSLNHLPVWKYYAYIIFYLFFFMLDDLIVFFTAMFTLQITGVTSKYSRISHLVGGIVMLLIGLLLIFKPEWLMFG